MPNPTNAAMTEREQILSAIVAVLQSDPRLKDVPIHCPPLSSYTVQGQNWPETIGYLTLMGPANRLGAWRWYKQRAGLNGAVVWRVKINHHLQPIWESVVTNCHA
jgi:hypothetical protein